MKRSKPTRRELSGCDLGRSAPSDDYIREAASPRVARRFTEAIVDQIAKLEDFPLRGSPRDDILPGLRTLGFRKRVTIAFVVEAAEVSILGVFYGGQDFETLLRVD